MMKKLSVMLLALISCSVIATAGENFILNGDFSKQNKQSQITFWNIPGKLSIEYFAKGGPNGGHIRLKHNAKQPNLTFRQYSKKLKANTDYKISFYVRGSKDFAAKRFYLLFINEGWTQNNAIRDIKITTEWQKVERVMKTTNFKKIAAIVFNVITTAGWVDIADVKIEAVAQK